VGYETIRKPRTSCTRDEGRILPNRSYDAFLALDAPALFAVVAFFTLTFFALAFLPVDPPAAERFAGERFLTADAVVPP
jgi:hypothetical protein